MSANIRETQLGFSKLKQADLTTPPVASDLFHMTKLNASLNAVRLRTENDADEIGKDNEFADNQYVTAWDINGSIEKYISSEFAAFLFAFGLGVPIVTNPVALTYRHTAVPQNPIAGGIELPFLSVVEQIRPGAGVVTDRMAVGCVLEDFAISLNSGPGRQSAKATCSFIGSGILIEPSVIVLPAKTPEHLLPGAGASIVINGEDYVAAKSIVSMDFMVKNNIRGDTGFFPGSGFQIVGDPTSGAVRGRMEWGNRQISFKFVARFMNGSTELTKLKAQTEGSATFGLTGAIITGATRHNLLVTMPRVRFADVVIQDAAGIVTVGVDCTAMNPTDGVTPIVTAYATNAIPVVG